MAAAFHNGRTMKRTGFLSIGLAIALLAGEARSEKIGTYNIRYDNPGDRTTGNAWPQRAPVIAGLIRFHDFDIVGTQEGFRHQIDDLIPLLPEYECSSHGRDDGAAEGEQIAIFFKKGSYRRLDEGCFWLSETPGRPSIGWDARQRRLCGWVKLRQRNGGEPFFVFVVHFDHKGPQSRQNSAKLVLSKVSRIAGTSRRFLMGDFNSNQSSTTYRILEDSPLFTDAFLAAEIRYAPSGTANRFDPAVKTDSRIDHVFVPEDSKVKRFGVLTDTYRAAPAALRGKRASANAPAPDGPVPSETKLPSDHFPVLVEIE